MEGYIRALADVMLALEPLTSKMSIDYNLTKKALEDVSKSKAFNQMSFDAAYEVLINSKSTAKYTQKSKFGRGIDSHGEKHLTVHHNDSQLLWLFGFDRDTVAFYQKPDPQNTNCVINADLLFPPLNKDGFGGEILGSGQRQDTPSEMIQSLKRQGISAAPYKWYIDLRNQPNYKTTAGFGLGIERFIAWSLGYNSIRDVILYPRLKNVLTLP
jgi:asparaginyl-tRNA synthetase